MTADGFAVLENYETKKKQLISQLKALKASTATICLSKDTSNLFRRIRLPGRGIDVRQFNQVISIDPIQLVADVEGMTTYEQLVDACLKHNCLPTVVPQLKTITVGGALTGVGIESSSFKYGLVHETVLEFEVMLADGQVVLCRPDNEYQDLFFGFANSYGTLGYALRVKMKLVPIKPYVKLTHRHFTKHKEYFETVEALSLSYRNSDKPYFIDGVAFAKDNLYLVEAELVDKAPYCSDYTFRNIYYQSIQTRKEDYLSIHDYIWRWDTDWFWCSKVFYAHNPLVRRLLGKKRLNSAFYGRVRRFFANNTLFQYFYKNWNQHFESIIQDVQIPIDKASTFLTFFAARISIFPLWFCPTMAYQSDRQFDLYAMNNNTLYVNFGFWDKVAHKGEAGYYNRLIEKKVNAMAGRKSLYSESYYTKEEFGMIYNQVSYEKLKNKYDPEGRLLGLFEKCCVLQ